MSERLYYLFHQYFNKTETPEERDELMQLIQQSNSEIWVHGLMEEVYKENHLEDDPFAAGVREKMLTAALTGCALDNTGANVVPLKKSLSWLVYAAAAILILTLSIGIFQYRSGLSRENLAANKSHRDILPGGNKATLTLSDGTKIELNAARNGKLVQQGSTSVMKLANGSLAYVPGASRKGLPLMNTMATPRGGQYQLQLPDGTVAMLNAESSISYPTAFTGGDRKVSVDGEVYFFVGKNKKMPFIVSFGDQKVEVLGTHFNIRAYRGQTNNTTLLEGSVKISAGNEKQILVPGEQAVYDKGIKKFHTKKVDTDDIIAWKNGLFLFDNTQLDLVMQELSRWYNIDVVYKGARPSLNFTGLLKRDVTLARVLKKLEATGGIKFTIADRQVIVEKN
jgi:transmembrane sensor